MATWWTWRDLILGIADQSYRHLFLREDKNLAKVIFLILNVWVISYIGLDYVVLGTGAGFFVLLAERLGFTIGTVLAFFYLKKNKDRNRLDLLVLGWSLALVVVSFSAIYLHPGINPDKISTHYVLIIGFYLIVPNRVIYKFVAAITIALLDSVLLIYLCKTTGHIFDYNVIIVIITLLLLNVIGLLVAARLERQRFHQYLIQKTLSSGREQLIALATTDSLTGILNRRGFFELAEIEVDRFQRYHTIFSFAIIDLDKLKSINDHHGHPTGDLALQTLIECIEHNKRSSDFLGRLAGDEFGLCMPGVHNKDAEILLIRIREKLKLQAITPPGGKPFQIHFSAGITEINPKDEHFDDIYRRADKALYKAKERGRDRIEIG